jgi:ribonuclease BN (tRNA processing enzyme)
VIEENSTMKEVEKLLGDARHHLTHQRFGKALQKIQKADAQLNELIRQQGRISRGDIHFHYHMVFLLAQNHIIGIDLDPDEFVQTSTRRLLLSFIEYILYEEDKIHRVERTLKDSLEATDDFITDFRRTTIGLGRNNANEFRLQLLELFSRRLSPKIIAWKSLRIILENYNLEKRKLDSYLNEPGALKRNHPNQFVFFKKWNSVDPLYPGQSGSLGGGYFLVWNKKGIIIDPGYGFLSQFFDDPRKFRMEDINSVIVSHAHDDHSHQVETIYSLAWKRCKSDFAPLFYGSEGSVVKFSRLLANSPVDPFTLVTLEKTTPLASNKKKLKSKQTKVIADGVTMEWMVTLHNENPWMKTNTGVALRFNFDDAKDKCSIGITGDGKYSKPKGYYKPLSKFFEGCKLLVVHVGAPMGSSNHLELAPAAELISDVKPELAVLTEFGLEFRPTCGRIGAAKIVQMLIRSNSKVISGDSGLCMRLCDLSILKTSSYDKGKDSYHSTEWVFNNRVRMRERTDPHNENDKRIEYY